MTALRNPSFEGITRPGGWTRDTYTGVSYGEIYVPTGWTAWWQEGVFRRPEMKVIQNVPPFDDPPRICDGDWAFQAFTMFGRQHAGLYQVVAGLLPGEVYELSAQAHAWSLHPGIGEQSPYCSAGVGCGAVYIPEGSAPEVDPDNPDPIKDAIGNFIFRVGVSYGDPEPLGAVDWGSGAHIYNVYHEVPPLRFIAPDDGKVTIYLCATSIWEFKTSDAYWDSVKLEKVDDTLPPPDCPGTPRVQYKRTYLLMHPSADAEWVEAAAEAVWDEHRYTIGGSADDAGLGALDVRNVIAVNPTEWPGDLEEFFTEYYPGLNYTAVEAATPNELKEKLSGSPGTGLLLWQCDPRWKDEMIASLGCSLTLCQTGCWIAASAMAQQHYIIKSDATPSTANRALGAAGGFSGCLTLWSGMTTLGLEVVKKTDSDTEAQAWLAKGYVCFAEVEPETYLHFVLVTRYQEGRFWMHDPYKNVEGWVDEYYPGVESWRLIRPSVPSPPPPPPPPPPLANNHIGLHLQTMSENWDGYLAEAKPRVTKVLASMHDVLGVLRVHPGTKIIWRHVDNDYGDVWGPDPRTGAQNWLKRFRDSLFEICDMIAREFPHQQEPYFYAECINEPYNSNAPDVIHAANIDIEYIHAIEALGLPVKAAVFCAAVGNPHHLGGQYESLLPLARVAAQTGSPFGYHNYWLGNPEYGGPEHLGKYLAFRWAEMDKVFRANGVKVYWYGGESGVVGGESGYNPDGTGWVHLNANSGWRGCYDGDWPRYEGDFVYVNDWLNQWNAEHGDYYWGLTIFTVGSHFTGWREFQLDAEQIDRLAVVLK